MAILEIPLGPVAPELVDPYYGQRRELAILAPSLPVIMLGRLADQAAFSRQFAGDDQASGEWYPGETEESNARDGLNIVITANKAIYSFNDSLAQFAEAIRMIAAHEHSAFPNAVYSKVLIDGDQSPAQPGTTQRIPGIHRDSSAGDWRHIYLVSDRQPTEFYIFPEETHMSELSRSTEGNPATRIEAAQPYELVFANGTTFHQSPRLSQETRRTFLRVAYVYDLAAASS
jgi:hypothetical protein